MKWSETSDWLIPLTLVAATVAGAVAMGMWSNAHARPGEQWAQLNDPETSAWFNRQKVPGTRTSCCGEGDAYYADIVIVDKDGVWAVITDEREDGPLGRPHIEPGTRIHIPPERNVDGCTDPNPTGHAIIFVRWNSEDGVDGNFGVFCYLPNGGV